MKLAARLRAAPVAVLLALVVVAVGSRLLRQTREVGLLPQPKDAPTVASAPLIPPGVASNALEPPLRLAPASDAAFPAPGAPRMIHGGPRHQHRAAGRGPRAVKVGFRVAIGPVAAQVVASPDERTLYAATFDGSLVALSRDDGARRWSVALGERMHSTPFVADDWTIYVGSDAKKLTAVNKDGAVLWRLEVDGEADTGPVLGRDGSIVFAAGDLVYAARRGGDLAWRFAAKGKVFTSPAIADDGLVVFGSQDHHVYALNAAGALAWAVDLGADVDGGPAISDHGAIHVGTDKGEVVRLDPRGLIVWRVQVGGFVRGVLSIARNGDVLVGTYGPVPRLVRIAGDGVVRGAFPIRGTGAREFGIHGGPLEDAGGALCLGRPRVMSTRRSPCSATEASSCPRKTGR